MIKSFNFYFNLINEYYGTKCAKRSGQPYMAHILEGLNVLKAINASENAKKAFMIHPIFQSDEDFNNNIGIYSHAIDPYILCLVLEYRKVANSYLSNMNMDLNTFEISKNKDVNDMLIADKIQNFKDFIYYYNKGDKKYRQLYNYFDNWLTLLEVDNFNLLLAPCFNYAVTCIIECNGEYLLLNRYSNDRTMAGQCNVGGKVDFGEKTKDALIREIQEELGLTFNETDFKYYDSFYANSKKGPIAVQTYKLSLNEKPTINLNTNEFESYQWSNEEQFTKFWNNDVSVDHETDIFVGVDFDGTVIEDCYPFVTGNPVPMAIETLKEMNANGIKIIVWTMRPSSHKEAVMQFFEKHGVEIYNYNCHDTQHKWTDSPKAYADYFIDDRNVGIPLNSKNHVDWVALRPQLQKLNLI